MECLTASQSTCVAPDGWVPECVGQCQCGSYTRLVARVGGVSERLRRVHKPLLG